MTERPSGQNRHICIPVLVAILLFGVLSAARANPAKTDTIKTAQPRIIDSVEIIAENVFDASDPRYDNFLFRLANKAHIVTRHSIISRELLLGKGDPFDTALVYESARNLRELDYILKTDIHLKKGDKGENILVVNTSDKWTTVGTVSYHQNGGQDDIQLGFEENNLLGYGVYMSHDYFILNNDRDFYQTELRDDRFLGMGFGYDVFYSDNPRIGRLRFSIGRPFYRLSQKWDGHISYSRIRQRVDYYYQEILAARDRFKSRSVQLSGTYRTGPKHVKYSINMLLDHSEETFSGRSPLNTDSIPAHVLDEILPQVGQDSTQNYFQVLFQLQQIRFRTYTQFNRFLKPEDFSLGWNIWFAVGKSFVKNIEDYIYLGFRPQYTIGRNSYLLVFGVLGENWSNDDLRLRRRISLFAKGYWQLHDRHTLVVGLRYTMDRLHDHSYTLYLDKEHGVRGYPAFYSGGEDRIVMNVEDRIFSDIEILSVGIGGVAFADIGNIWAKNVGFDIGNTVTAFGLGLRLGTSRSTRAEVVRLDAAYSPRRGRIQFSVGTSQFF